MKNCNGKTRSAILTGALIGTAIGGMIGVLYAPNKGKKTRRKIRHAVVGTAYDVSKAVKESKDDIIKAVQNKL